MQPSIAQITARLTQEEQALPLTINTGWEGPELMEVCLVVTHGDCHDGGGPTGVCLMFNIMPYALQELKIHRLLYIGREGDAWGRAYDMEQLAPWNDVLEIWD